MPLHPAYWAIKGNVVPSTESSLVNMAELCYIWYIIAHLNWSHASVTVIVAFTTSTFCKVYFLLSPNRSSPYTVPKLLKDGLWRILCISHTWTTFFGGRTETACPVIVLHHSRHLLKELCWYPFATDYWYTYFLWLLRISYKFWVVNKVQSVSWSIMFSIAVWDFFMSYIYRDMFGRSKWWEMLDQSFSTACTGTSVGRGKFSW